MFRHLMNCVHLYIPFPLVFEADINILITVHYANWKKCGFFLYWITLKRKAGVQSNWFDSHPFKTRSEANDESEMSEIADNTHCTVHNNERLTLFEINKLHPSILNILIRIWLEMFHFVCGILCFWGANRLHNDKQTSNTSIFDQWNAIYIKLFIV